MTAIRQIELSTSPCDLSDLSGYDRCMVVMRWRGRVVGRVLLPVTEGRIAMEAIERAVAGEPGQNALSRWLDEIIGREDARARAPDLPATVAICTRERPQDLDRALDAVLAQRHPDYEVLVVDNAPVSDRTRRVAARRPGVRYVAEPVQGLDAARNRALAEAVGEVVAFTDDDAVPEPEWLGALLRNFGDRRVACATGLVLPLELHTEAQELFESYCTFARGFSRRVFDGCSMNPLAVGSIGAGASMAVRRDAVLALGGFDERLDAGTPTRSGGDHELFTRILAAGDQIVYDPDAVSWHRHRRTHDELMEVVHGYGVGVYATWTKLLLERGELGVLKLAWIWLRDGQLPALIGRGERPAQIARIAREELRGCLRGPGAWLRARRRRRPECRC